MFHQMSTNPLITIIIPTFNSELFLTDCLNSVSEQTYSNLEVIIVDGGSTDDTRTIVSNYLLSNPLWKLFITNPGVSHQRNVGIDNSRGEYIFFLDSDDYISHNLIHSLYSNLIENQLDLITPSICSLLYKDGNLIQSDYLSAKIIQNVTPSNFFEEGYDSFLAGPTKLYKKVLFNGIRHNEELSYGEDLLFNYEIVKNGAIKYDIDGDATYYYRHDANITNIATKRMNKSGYLFCNKMVDVLRGLQKGTKNYNGALGILKVNIDLYIDAYLSQCRIIPFRLTKTRLFMFCNTKGKRKFYYLFPKLFLLVYSHKTKHKMR